MSFMSQLFESIRKRKRQEEVVEKHLAKEPVETPVPLGFPDLANLHLESNGILMINNQSVDRIDSVVFSRAPAHRYASFSQTMKYRNHTGPTLLKIKTTNGMPLGLPYDLNLEYIAWPYHYTFRWCDIAEVVFTERAYQYEYTFEVRGSYERCYAGPMNNEQAVTLLRSEEELDDELLIKFR